MLDLALSLSAHDAKRTARLPDRERGIVPLPAPRSIHRVFSDSIQS